MKLTKILVVEDDEVDFIGLIREFKKHGVSVETSRAIDGMDAIQRLNNQLDEKPMLVLLDLNLPRMTGLEFLNEIRSLPQHKNLTVMVLTTSRCERDLKAAYQYGVAGYLVKDDLGGAYSEAIQLIKQYTEVVEFPAA